MRARRSTSPGSLKQRFVKLVVLLLPHVSAVRGARELATVTLAADGGPADRRRLEDLHSADRDPPAGCTRFRPPLEEFLGNRNCCTRFVEGIQPFAEPPC